MEGLAPAHQLCLELKFGLESGEAVRTTLQRIATRDGAPMREEVLEVLLDVEKGSVRESKGWTKTPYRTLLRELILAGLRGETIIRPLIGLEKEMRIAVEQQLEEHLGHLPLKLTVLMVFFQLPPIFLVIFWPMIFELIGGLS